MTCAHVIQQVVGPTAGSGPGEARIALDHPGSLSGEVSYASVLPGGWAPPDEGRADVAVLGLEAPAPADCAPARLRPCGPARGRDVRLFGQSTAEPPGLWVTSRLVGAGGLSPDWVQLDGSGLGGAWVLGGFSGAGVVDGHGDVIGIVVAALRDETARIAWMIPVEALVRYCPLLTDAVTAELPPAPAWPAGSSRELTTALVRIPSMRDPQRRERVLRDTGEDFFDLVERSSVLLEDVRGIVEVCLQYADGIDRLAAALRWYERGSLPMREFERVLRRLRGEPEPAS